MSDPYILGTRGSALALTQSTLAAEHIVQVFNAHSREHGAERTLSFDITTVKTDGDVLTGPLANLGGTGVFAAALRQRLLDGDTPGGVDVAVHSLKDLPAEPCPGLVIAAILEREDPRDALV
ncbi:MAG: hydroxymethylbilane synthase, partial [Rothia dentocariosa]